MGMLWQFYGTSVVLLCRFCGNGTSLVCGRLVYRPLSVVECLVLAHSHFDWDLEGGMRDVIWQLCGCCCVGCVVMLWRWCGGVVQSVW